MDVNLFFYLFFFFIIMSSLMLILSRHSVFSLLFLISCFIFSSCLLFLLECEFLALLFVVVYVGAIAILFLFAIMMLESKKINLARNTIKYFPIGVFFSVFFVLPLLNLINKNFTDTFITSYNFYLNNYTNWYDLIDSNNDVNVYGKILYSYFVLQFLIAGLILLLVLIGVVCLTSCFEKKTKQQAQFRQLARKSQIF